MVSIDGSLFVQVINFLLLIWALNIVLYKPIRRILSERKNKILDFEAGINQYERDVAEKDKTLKAGLKDAREKGLKEKEDYEQAAREQEAKLIEKINEKARADLAEIRAKVENEAEAARIALQTEIDSFADDISRKILGRAV